mgnify:CR=1 FL=1
MTSKLKPKIMMNTKMKNWYGARHAVESTSTNNASSNGSKQLPLPHAQHVEVIGNTECVNFLFITCHFRIPIDHNLINHT